MVLVHFVRIGEKIINWTLSWNYWFSEQNHSLCLGIIWFVSGKSTFHGFFKITYLYPSYHNKCDGRERHFIFQAWTWPRFFQT